MKRASLLLLLFFPIVVLASPRAEQVPPFEEDGTRISLWIPGFLIKTGAKVVSQEEPELAHIIRHVGSITVNVVEGNKLDARHERKAERRVNRYQKRNFKPLVTVLTPNEKVQVSMKWRKDRIKRLVVVVLGEEEYVHVNMKCNFSLPELLHLMEDNDWMSS